MVTKNYDRTVRHPHLEDSQPCWIHLPIAEAYCETLRHQGQRRTATTFHAVVNAQGKPDRLWVACSECTSLMMDDLETPVP